MKQYIKLTFGIIFSLTLLSSCEDFLEVEPEEVVLTDNYLGDDALDARSALFGILAQAQDLYGQMRVLGEMRGDLVDINENTIEEIKEIRDLDFNEENQFVDPTQLFSMINNCNFAIAGIDKEAYDGVLLDEYAAIVRLRTWLQMQILIHYGKLPYIDEPIVSSDDFNKDYPVYGFEEALNQLIINLSSPDIAEVDNPTEDGVYSLIPNNDILLGDLYLWAKDYENAAISYKRFLDNQFGGGPIYLMNSNLVNVDGSDGSYTEDNNWLNMFFTTSFSNEMINQFTYNDDYQQSNNDFPIIFNQFQPSEAIIQKWDLQSKYSQDDHVAYETGDNRIAYADFIFQVGYGDGVVVFSGQRPILKYTIDYFNHRYNRAAKVYLRYAEAINYAGYPNHALEIVNGIFNNPDVLPINSVLLSNTPVDVEYLHFNGKGYFDDDDEPTSGLRGVRGRAAMAPVSVAALSNPPLDDDGLPLIGQELVSYYENNTVDKTENIIYQVGNLILEEAALELAFEGNRWEDLVRFSRREGTSDIIKNAIETKFVNSSAGYGNLSVLDSESGWYLPLSLPDNFTTD